MPSPQSAPIRSLCLLKYGPVEDDRRRGAIWRTMCGVSEDVTACLLRLGGVASRADLLRLVGRGSLDTALRKGEVEIVAHGIYRLQGADTARTAAHALCGTVSHLSAALHWGWAVKTVPALPEVTVGRKRNLTGAQRKLARIAFCDLLPDDHHDGVTSQDRTLVDCLRREEVDSGYAVADSAIRAGFAHPRLAALGRDARGPHAGKIRFVISRADGEADNPFESVLRAIADDVPGLSVRPQVPIFGPDFMGRPDLVDEALHIIIEADSFEWHGGRAQLQRDSRRYDEFAVSGWLVLRFSWEDVMFDPAWVREMLVRAVRLRSRTAA